MLTADPVRTTSSTSRKASRTTVKPFKSEELLERVNKIMSLEPRTEEDTPRKGRETSPDRRHRHPDAPGKGHATGDRGGGKQSSIQDQGDGDGSA
jgi:hypothetical protein